MTMPDSIFSRINVSDSIFTSSEKKVAEFVKNNPQKALGASISDLARLCGVSDSTIFRFCRTLHFKGYQEFKTTLAQSVGLDRSENEFQINVKNKKISKTDSIESVCLKLQRVDLDAIEETRLLLNIGEVDRAVMLLQQAKNIFFYGCGTTSVTALHACSKFQRITNKAFYSTDHTSLHMRMSLMDREDVVVVFSYSGQTDGMEEMLDCVLESGAKMVCITRFTNSPVTEYADVVLLCGADEGPFQAGSLSITIAQLYLVDILYTEYFKRTYDESKKNTEKTAKIFNS